MKTAILVQYYFILVQNVKVKTPIVYSANIFCRNPLDKEVSFSHLFCTFQQHYIFAAGTIHSGMKLKKSAI